MHCTKRNARLEKSRSFSLVCRIYYRRGIRHLYILNTSILKRRQLTLMEQHIKILGWLYVLLNAAFAIFGAITILGGLAAGVGSSVQNHSAGALLASGVGAAIGAFLLIIGLPGLILGYGLLTRRSWSRILGIILSILELFNFPLGTLLGIYGLYVLLNQETVALLNN
jgi:hypothetical protein